jgi:hypothetical protein
MNTNFYASLDMILDAIVENKMKSEDVQDMVLVILSDMIMDKGYDCNNDKLCEGIKKKYAEAGIRVNNIPYKLPHILFWNFRSRSGFPCLSFQPNISMFSGFSHSSVNLFYDKDINSLQFCTPWSKLERILQNKRYEIMSDKLNEIIF